MSEVLILHQKNNLNNINKSKQNLNLTLQTCPMFVTTMHSIPLKIDNNNVQGGGESLGIKVGSSNAKNLETY
jgi:hypothetical protein